MKLVHIDIANVKMASFEIGKTAGLVVNQLQKKAEDNHLTEKVFALKAEAMDKYNKETGRNASVDGTILKYTAVATAGAITLTSMPAVLIGTAAATAAIGIASTRVTKATKVFSEATGRDGEKDKATAKEVVKETRIAMTEAAASIKKGYESARKPSPSK